MNEDDPRKAKTLEEDCSNGDGTYNLLRCLSWLSAAVSKTGKGFSVEECRKIAHEVISKRGKNE